VIALLLAAAAAVSYGAADFSGALASKRVNAMVITVVVQAVSLVALNAMLVIVPEDDRRWTDLGWAALAGLGAALALVCFYRALAIGPMSTAAAVTAAVGTAVPVVVALALGERPSALTLAGVALCLPGAVLVSVGTREDGHRATTLPRARVGQRSDVATTVRLSILAGIGFGIFFVALSRVSADSGLFPLLGARTASIVALSALLFWRRGWEPLGRADWPLAIVAGVLDFAANAGYLLAVTRGELAWVAAITSLYPVATVLLARVVLKERLAPVQVVGLGVAAGALVLVTLGR
jgi:drug/metabolite transporter (DMT)-like permease